MGDYFDQAAASDTQAKLDLLGQIAQNGSQAAQAFQGAQTQIGQAKADALAQALSGARSRGAPQAEQDQIAATVGHQYDNTLGSLSAQAANRASSFGQLSSAAGTYMDQAAASMPSLRTALAQKVATLQANARAGEGRDQYQLEQSRITAADQAATRAATRDAAAAAAAKAAQPPGVGKILTDQFGGLTGFQDLVTSQAPQLRAAQNADYRAQQSDLRGLGAHGNLAARADSREADPGLTPVDVADALGQSAGLPAGQGAAFYQGYLDKQAATDQKAAQSAAGVRQGADYQSAAVDLLNGVKAGRDTATIAQALTQQYGPDVARQVLGDYSAALPSKPLATG